MASPRGLFLVLGAIVSDVLIVIAGGAIGFISAWLLRLLSSSIGQKFLDHGAYLFAHLVGFLGVLACLAVLVVPWGGPHLSQSYSWQYTPILMLLTCVGVFVIYLALDWYRARQVPKRTIGVLSKRNWIFHRKLAAAILATGLLLFFLALLFATMRP